VWAWITYIKCHNLSAAEASYFFSSLLSRVWRVDLDVHTICLENNAVYVCTYARIACLNFYTSLGRKFQVDSSCIRSKLVGLGKG
jgi:hypothetical protein